MISQYFFDLLLFDILRANTEVRISDLISVITDLNLRDE